MPGTGEYAVLLKLRSSVMSGNLHWPCYLRDGLLRYWSVPSFAGHRTCSYQLILLFEVGFFFLRVGFNVARTDVGVEASRLRPEVANGGYDGQFVIRFRIWAPPQLWVSGFASFACS